MSALPPKADMVQDGRDVRFVPEADITSTAPRRFDRGDVDLLLSKDMNCRRRAQYLSSC
jgi:hypothetical protein